MGNIINRVFESAGPDGKVRGTPQQIIDKYQALARDAQVSGDRVAAESYLQHSEHYSRLLGEAQRQQAENRFNNQDRDDQRNDQRGGGDDGGSRDGGNYEQRRQQQPQQHVASGLAMIDPEDSDDFGGPIETPESRRERGNDAGPMLVVENPPAENPPAEQAAEPAAAEERREAAPKKREKKEAKPQAEAAAAESGEEAPAPKRRRRTRTTAPAPAPEPEPEPSAAQAE